MIIVYKKKNYLKFEYFLKHDVYYDIDGLDLFSELKILKEILQRKDYTPIDILNYIKRLDSFPNTCIAYKINKIISKIDNVLRKIKWISYIID